MHCHVKWDPSREVWYARPYLGRSSDNKPIQPYREFPEAQTEEEAQAMADEWADHMTANGLVDSAILTDLLYDYIDMRLAGGCSPNSARSYRLFTRYVDKFLHGANARDLRVRDFNRFESRLMEPKNKGGQALCRNTVRNVHDFLNGAYKHFVTEGICEFNPIAEVKKPKLEKHEAAALNIGDFVALDNQLKALLKPQVLNPKTYRDMVVAFAAWLALVTGMRVGEVCAVRPVDVFVMRLYIHVSGSVIEYPKRKPYRREETKGHMCRNLDIFEADLATIQEFLAAQKEVCGSLRSDAPIVTVDGSFMRPTSISNAFSKLAKTLDLPRGFSFHGLRHTHAAWLLSHGVDLETVSKRLGHADEATTLRNYAHVLKGNGAYAAQVFNEAARRAVSGETERMTLGE